MGIYDSLLRVYRNLRRMHMNLRRTHMNALCFSSYIRYTWWPPGHQNRLIAMASIIPKRKISMIYQNFNININIKISIKYVIYLYHSSLNNNRDYLFRYATIGPGLERNKKWWIYKWQCWMTMLNCFKSNDTAKAMFDKDEQVVSTADNYLKVTSSDFLIIPSRALNNDMDQSEALPSSIYFCFQLMSSNWTGRSLRIERFCWNKPHGWQLALILMGKYLEDYLKVLKSFYKSIWRCDNGGWCGERKRNSTTGAVQRCADRTRCAPI